MPKQTDITGTFRIPEEAWGRFWNTMRSIPGAEIMPTVAAETPAKRVKGTTSDGSTVKCILLRTIGRGNGGVMPRAMLIAALEEAGKAATSFNSAIVKIVEDGQARKTKTGYALLGKGRAYLNDHCNANKE